MNETNTRTLLLGSLSQRWRPEDTVSHIDALIGARLTAQDRALLQKARGRWYRSSMATEFVQASSINKRTNLIRLLGDELDAAPWRTRLRNRRTRLAKALQKRQSDWRRTLPMLAQFAETVYASTLTAHDLTDDATLCFVAYLTARMGVRSTFTNTAQDKPFNTVCEMLYRYVAGAVSPNWFAMACVFPRADVMEHLTHSEKLTLLDRSRKTLEQVSEYLERTATEGHINVKTMIVHKGNDSSTWNALAGAWNRAREWYFASLDSLGWLGTLDFCCPGKVLRLMAGDVAFWHGSSGGDLHPDTKVWRELPEPWRVLSGEVSCTRQMVKDACFLHGVDPVKSGWIGPRERTAVEAFRPTPELVYGVEVNHPALAGFLRKIGVFSGKAIRVPVYA